MNKELSTWKLVALGFVILLGLGCYPVRGSGQDESAGNYEIREIFPARPTGNYIRDTGPGGNSCTINR